MNTFVAKCAFCGTGVVRKQVMSVYYCGISCKAAYQRLAKPVTEEWLRDAYLVRGMNCTEIAHQVKRDPKSVWNWLQDFGIPTRPRGSNWRLIPKGGFKGKKHTPENRERMSKAAKESRRVPYYPAVGSYMKGRTGADTPNWKGGITPERQAFYLTEEWKDAVKAVWKRDGFACVRCAKDLRHKTGQCAIHHIESFAVKAKRAKVSNLILLCKPCHLWVHSRKNKQREYLK